MHMPLLKELQLENKRLKEDLNNLIPSVSGEGENITLNGTAEASFKKFLIKGNTFQETREEKNTTISNFEVGSINGETGENLDTPIRARTDFIDFDIKKGIFEYTGNIENLQVTAFCYKNDKYLGYVDGCERTWTRFPFNFSVLEGTNKIRVIIRTASDEDLTNKLSSIVLNLKMFAMPSPDFLSEIKNVDKINFKVCNENLLNLKEAKLDSAFSNINLTINDNGSLKVDAETGYLVLNIPKIILKPGTYTFVRNFSGAHNSVLSNGIMNIIAIPYNTTYKTVTFNEEVEITQFTGALLTEDCYFMLYEGEYEKIDYIQHQDQQFTFPLKEGQELYKGDYFVKKIDKWYIHNAIKKVFLKDLTWTKRGNRIASMGMEDIKVPLDNHDTIRNFMQYFARKRSYRNKRRCRRNISWCK